MDPVADQRGASADSDVVTPYWLPLGDSLATPSSRADRLAMLLVLAGTAMLFLQPVHVRACFTLPGINLW